MNANDKLCQSISIKAFTVHPLTFCTLTEEELIYKSSMFPLFPLLSHYMLRLLSFIQVTTLKLLIRLDPVVSSCSPP